MGKEGNSTSQRAAYSHKFKYASASLEEYHGLSTAKHIQQKKVIQQHHELNVMARQTQYVDYVLPTRSKITGEHNRLEL